MAERTLHLNLNLGAVGHPTAFIDPQYYAETARIAERGLFDSIFLANISGLRSGVPAQGLDTIIVLTIIAQATEKIGMIGTSSTTLNHPYSIARWFASLEHVSKGRVGWNVVTTRNNNEGLNYGFDPLPDRITRYERAIESIEVVTAPVGELESRRHRRRAGCSRPFRQHKMGSHQPRRQALLGSRSAATALLSPHASTVDPGRRFRRRHRRRRRYVDAVFTPELYLDTAQANYRKLKDEAARYGRDPETISVLPA